MIEFIAKFKAYYPDQEPKECEIRVRAKDAPAAIGKAKDMAKKKYGGQWVQAGISEVQSNPRQR